MKLTKFQKDLIIVLLIVVAAFLIDFITKAMVVKNLYLGESKSIIGDFFHITRARNNGAAWSIFSGKMSFLVAVTFLSLGLFFYFLREADFKNNKIYSISISFLIGGTLGNFYDRVTAGYVVDFLDFNIFGYDFPIFNFADIFLVSGVIGLFLYFIFIEGKKHANK